MLSCRPKGIINSLKAETPWRCFTAAGDSRTVYEVGTKHTLLNHFALQLLTSFNYRNKTSPPPTPGFCPVLQQGIHAPGEQRQALHSIPLQMSPEHRPYEVTCPGGTWEARAPVRSRTRVLLSPSSHAPSSATLIVNSSLLSHPLKRIFLPSSRPLLACSPHFAFLPPPASSPASTPSTCSPCS